MLMVPAAGGGGRGGGRRRRGGEGRRPAAGCDGGGLRASLGGRRLTPAAPVTHTRGGPGRGGSSPGCAGAAAGAEPAWRRAAARRRRDAEGSGSPPAGPRLGGGRGTAGRWGVRSRCPSGAPRSGIRVPPGWLVAAWVCRGGTGLCLPPPPRSEG